MKTAIVHDFLINKGGAEKVLDAIYECFPSPIYTLMKSGSWQYKEIKSVIKQDSFLTNYHRYFLPFYPKLIEEINLSSYDCIISSSYAFAKNILTHSNQKHICYCHSPMRSIHDLYFEELERFTGLKKFFFKHISHNLRNWDLTSSNRVDVFIANSKFVANRIEKIYRRKVDAIIYPPVDIEKHEISNIKENYFIFIGRLVGYKRVDILVKAFADLPNEKLLIIGVGPELLNLKKIATKNVEFLGYQSDDSCRKLLSRSKAFLFMGIEDFGITLVEAIASGVPLIAYKLGGAEEILIPGTNGIFVEKQNEESLINILIKFNKIEFDQYIIRETAKKFGKNLFKLSLENHIKNSFLINVKK